MEFIDGDLILYLSCEVNELIESWLEISEGEFSALGIVEEVEKGFLVKEIFLPEQNCSNAETVIEPEAVAKLLLELENAGYDPSRLRFWFHSHAHMEVFWSKTDLETISLLANDSYFISMVANKRGEYLVRVDIYHPCELHFDEVPVKVQIPSLGLKELAQELFFQRVQTQTLPAYQDIYPEVYYYDEFLEDWWEEERRFKDGFHPTKRDF